MSGSVSKPRQAAACGLLALFGAAFAVQADDSSVRPAAARHLIFMNATVVAVDAEAGTLTVNGAQPDAPPTPAPTAQPTPSPLPQPTPPASAPSRERPLPTDVVGPFRDRREDPHFDPRVNPHRDPRVIWALTEPAPTPTPTPRQRKNGEGATAPAVS